MKRKETLKVFRSGNCIDNFNVICLGGLNGKGNCKILCNYTGKSKN